MLAPDMDTVIRNSEEVEADNERLRTALKRSMIAIDDWLNTEAEELCDEERVKQARARIAEWGTIGYIADVQAQNRKALGE